MDWMFAIGFAFTGTGVKFQVDLFHNHVTDSKVSLGVDNLGRFGIYNGSTFQLLPELGTVAFSVDSTGDGTYTDPGNVLNVYRLRIVGNYAASTPNVSIYTSDANSLNLDHQAVAQTCWVGGRPRQRCNPLPETAVFYNYTAPVLLGQIALRTGTCRATADPQRCLTGDGDRWHLLHEWISRQHLLSSDFNQSGCAGQLDARSNKYLRPNRFIFDFLFLPRQFASDVLPIAVAMNWGVARLKRAAEKVKAFFLLCWILCLRFASCPMPEPAEYKRILAQERPRI